MKSCLASRVCNVEQHFGFHNLRLAQVEGEINHNLISLGHSDRQCRCVHRVRQKTGIRANDGIWQINRWVSLVNL